MIQFSDVNEIQKHFYAEILHNGEHIRVRDKQTREITNVSFCLINPRNRITTLKGRNWNYTLAIGELLWHLQGSNELNSIAYYNAKWCDFSDNGREISGSCYGKKIFKKEKKIIPWDQIKKLIKTDINTRRAVINLFDNTQHLNIESLDYSCVVNIQFLVRQNKLDMIVNMRSNDLFFGLPYDVFVFTFLQEILCVELGIPLGTYYHNTTSLHVYDRHFDNIQKILLLNQSKEINPQSSFSSPIAITNFRTLAKKLQKWVSESRDYEFVERKIAADKNLAIFFTRLVNYSDKKKESSGI